MSQKNINILPNTLVPTEIRIETYKKAIDIVKSGEPKHNVFPHGLCLLLPCVLWNLQHYCDDAPSEDGWNYHDTKNMFPELTQMRLDKIKGIDWTDDKAKNRQRINCLRGMIKQAEATLQKELIKEITDLL
jgi:hypothetical protein